MSSHTWWQVSSEGEGYMFIDAPTRGKARSIYADTYGAVDCTHDDNFLHTRARRYAYLDVFDRATSPDALMARLRHGDWVPDNEAVALTKFPPACGGFLDDRGKLPDGSYDVEWCMFNKNAMRDEEDYRSYACFVGAEYPDRYCPKMKVSEKAYFVYDKSGIGDEGTSDMVFASDANEARYLADVDEPYIERYARRAEWFDRYYQMPDSADAMMAKLRHGWFVPVKAASSKTPFSNVTDSDGNLKYPERRFRNLKQDYISEYDMHSEKDYRDYALFIGAGYPDYCKPSEGKDEAANRQ